MNNVKEDALFGKQSKLNFDGAAENKNEKEKVQPLFLENPVARLKPGVAPHRTYDHSMRLDPFLKPGPESDMKMYIVRFASMMVSMQRHQVCTVNNLQYII